MNGRKLQPGIDNRSRVKRRRSSTPCDRDPYGPGYRLFGARVDERGALRLQTKREGL